MLFIGLMYPHLQKELGSGYTHAWLECVRGMFLWLFAWPGQHEVSHELIIAFTEGATRLQFQNHPWPD